MSGDGFKFQFSAKDGDQDMANVRGDSLEEFLYNLENYPHAAVAQFKAQVRGAAALGAIAAPVQQQAPQQWQPPAQQQYQPPAQPAQAPPAWAQPQQPAQGGKPCAMCGKPLVHNITRTGKPQMKCPEYRYSQGVGGNGHTVDWL